VTQGERRPPENNSGKVDLLWSGIVEEVLAAHAEGCASRGRGQASWFQGTGGSQIGGIDIPEVIERK